MNDHDLKRQLARLPVPAADAARENEALQESLRAFRAAGEDERAAAAAAWTWRDWLWPSPLVWSGFAVLWLIMIVRSTLEHVSAPSNSPASVARNERPASTAPSMLLARQDLRDLMRQFQEEKRTP
jgi:hypothetical protein